MSKKSKAEKELRELYFNQAYLESLEQELEVLNDEYGLQGVSYDGVGSSTDISDATGDTATRLADKKVLLMLKITKQENKVKHIVEVLKLLTDREHKIVMMYYIEYKPWWKIANEIGYSIRQTQRIKDDAIAKVSIGLYGSDE